MGYRTISQIAMIIAALFIVFAVIKPKLDSIKIVEDEAAQYQEAVKKTSEYNSSLAALVSTKDSFTRDELEKLEHYLPSSVDTITVMADIKAIADRSGLDVVGIGLASSDDGSNTGEKDDFVYDGDDLDGEPQMDDRPKTSHKDYVFNAQGDYAGIKTFLATLEYNQYPLEVVAMHFAAQENSKEAEGVSVSTEPLFTYTIMLRVYSYTN